MTKQERSCFVNEYVGLHKDCGNTGKIPKIPLQDVILWNWHYFIFSGSLKKFSLVLLQITNKHIYSPCFIIRVKGFCPLKIKITQFPEGFHLNNFCNATPKRPLYQCSSQSAPLRESRKRSRDGPHQKRSRAIMALSFFNCLGLKWSLLLQLQ